MATAFVALGSNLGDREGYLRAATDAIGKTETFIQASSIYETEPVGYLNQPAFLNMVIEVESHREPVDLLRRLREVEHTLHRERPFPNAPRTIDLDLLLVDDVILDTAELTLPHPRMQERSFVLVPLVEIAPEVVVPTKGQTVKELLDSLGDTSRVIYWGEH